MENTYFNSFFFSFLHTWTGQTIFTAKNKRCYSLEQVHPELYYNPVSAEKKKDIKILNGKKASCLTTERATAFQSEWRREHVNKAIGLNV